MAARSYARFSTDKQSESSVADQLTVCREFAKSRGWSVASEHSDFGISGAAMGNRPGVQAAIGALEPRDILLVTDLSRLSRSQDLAPLLSRLRHREVRVIGVQDGFDSESRTARMQAGMSGIMSEEFRFMIADRVHSALHIRAKDGRPTGGKPYQDRAIVEEMFTRYAAGESLLGLASDLNRRGVPSPGANWKARGNPRGRWLVSAVRAILRNERYSGREIWNKSRWVKDPDTGKRIRRERPEAEWVVRPCEAWVSAETWSAVQARFRTAQNPGGKRRFLLSGLLECAWCGSKLVVVGGAQHRYGCGAFHHGGPAACKMDATFPRIFAEEEVINIVTGELLSDEAIDEGVREMKANRQRTPAAPINHELEELRRLVRAGILSQEVAAPAIEAAKAKGQSSEPVPMQVWPSPAAWRQAVKEMREILTGDNVLAARGALASILGPLRAEPANEEFVRLLWDEQEVMVATGTSRWRGSGGPLRHHLPISVERTLLIPRSTVNRRHR